MKRTLAIVVTYNRCVLLTGCLDALRAQSPSCDVLIVDNASTDHTAEAIKPLLSNTVFYVRLPQNTGGAGGFNFGMRWGVEHGYDYLWIMDDDVFPETTALTALLDAAKLLNDQFGFLSSVALWTDGKECRMNRQTVQKRFFEHIELLGEGILAIRQATFVSCFFRRETVMAYGLPIREFFIWGDDIEYTRRLAVRKKLPCYLVGKSLVVHRMAHNAGSDIFSEPKDRLGRYAYAYRNENYLYRKEGLRGVAYYCARCALHLFRIWAKAGSLRLMRSGILLGAFFRGWFFNPQIEYIEEKADEYAL